MALRAVLRSPFLAKTQWHGVQPAITSNVIKETGRVVITRQGGSAKFPVRYSYDTHNTARRIWEDVTFWAAVHGSIVFSIIIAVNLIQGKPRLADIPEGYEPEHWEYYEHPITRFQAKWFMPDPALKYEITMETHFREYEKRKIKLLNKKVRNLNQRFADYEMWYAYTDHTHAEVEEIKKEQMTTDIIGVPQSRIGGPKS